VLCVVPSQATMHKHGKMLCCSSSARLQCVTLCIANTGLDVRPMA
jgi:hypothetical protein